ncbi:DUF551 domain-containing protein [Escherichia coli]|uniref:DUF551 domain-containing protein n=1 Tax=Escherichia coli TaxID=562 RepID=UPI001CCB834F|nr:DUF551 domain-containing protein [Escherichia coli]MCO4969682.1 DUF551 domain-containing protein [Escherichia coli]MCS1119660.1 DUF551 domain-containing protein [Escherichia coli]MDM8881051.1 DUF551 domain-containing protein [Escherichia coli]MDM8907461.1 DUF551 domain-containing protein [Escherichia coli]WNU65863.1 DUF551 domain-containing protein [Escherichia coli]
MTTITRENAEIKSFITGFLSDPAHDNQSTDSLLANVFRIAQASLEAELVAWMRDDADGREYNARNEFSGGGRGVPLYATPPAPVVPEEKPMPNPLSMYAVDAVAAIAEVRGWNDCRAAMLHGKSEQPQNAQQNIPENIPGGNSPVTPDGWISCSERMPSEEDVLVYCSDTKEQMVGFHKGKGLFQFFYMNGVEGVCEPSHWMPLPEPPQEVK